MIKITVEQTRNIVAAGNGLAKTIRSSDQDQRHWDYIVNQIANPDEVRPIKPYPYPIDPALIFDSSINTFKMRSVQNRIRGTTKKTGYTKKTSVVALPPSGRIKLFDHKLGDSLGLLLDKNQAKLSPRYIFNRSINSDSKPWLYRRYDSFEKQVEAQVHPVSFEQLQQEFEQHKDTLAPTNELLVRLRRQAVIGTFANGDNLILRMGALALQAYIFNKLGSIVPVFYFNEFGMRNYTLSQRLADIKLVKSFPDDHPAKRYYNQYCHAEEDLACAFAESAISHTVKDINAEHNTLERAILSDEFLSQNLSLVTEKLQQLSIDHLIQTCINCIETQRYFSTFLKLAFSQLITSASLLKIDDDFLTQTTGQKLLYLRLLTAQYSDQFKFLDRLLPAQTQPYRVYLEIRKRISPEPNDPTVLIEEHSFSGDLYLGLYHTDNCRFTMPVLELLTELRVFETQLKKYSSTFNITWTWKSDFQTNDKKYFDFQDFSRLIGNRLKNLKTKLLLRLDEANNYEYILTEPDKRLLEAHYLSKIGETKTIHQLDQLSVIIRSRPSFQHHRRTVYDRLFFKDQSRFQTNILKAIERQTIKITKTREVALPDWHTALCQTNA